jgi:hypothetical protein
MTVESQTEQRKLEILVACQQAYGINPMVVYCQSTGAPIADMLPAEFDLLLFMIPSNDVDEIADDLFVRTIASMRPSPSLNLVRPDSFNRLRISAPAQLCALLLGKMYRPRDKMYDFARQTFEQRIEAGRRQIAVWSQISQLDFSKSEAQWFLHYLIELDTRFDLNQVDSLAALPARIDHFEAANLKIYADALATLVTALQSKKDRMEHQAALHSSWLASGGNRTTRSAYVGSFLALAPIGAEKKKELEKKARVATVRQMLASVMLEMQPKVEPKPAFTPGIAANGMPKFRLIGKAR